MGPPLGQLLAKKFMISLEDNTSEAVTGGVL